MRGPRRKAREAALRALYTYETRGRDLLDDLPGILSKVRDRAYAERLVRGCVEHRASLDALISAAAKNWRLSRIAPVERNILRIACLEILHEPEVPRSVAIDEAIRLAKRYGGAESHRFVNGVLDSIAKRSMGKGEEEE